MACEDSGSTVSSPSPCYCPSTSRTVAFTDGSILKNVMSLPASLGSSVSWEDVTAYASAHSLTSVSSSPTASSSHSLTQVLPPVSASATVSTSVAPSTQASLTTSTVSLPYPSTATAAAPTQGLSTGKKVGIAMGSGAAALILLLLALLLFRRMRRRQETKEEPRKPPMMDLTRPHSDIGQPDPDMRSPAWSGHKSELAADETTSVSPAPLYQAFSERPESVEVEGKPARLSPARHTHDGGYTLPGHNGTYYEMAG
ncbi:hypothetical protein PV11_06212 [Exophiala sideris]|uniref:Uncharacterized protein n=1 Tax=Exophiala sideris TaxID=1016849 RepID=A0A0D1YUQ4_9EURO|nr:hypothetical protein PV11_06212 [Exophiala sideris]